MNSRHVYEFFDDDGLFVDRDDLPDAVAEFAFRPDDGIVADPLARSLEKRFDDGGQGNVGERFSGRLDDQESGIGDAVIGKDFLGPRFVETDAERQRIGSGVGNIQHFAYRRDVGLAIRPEDPLGDIENQMRPETLETRVGLIVGFDREDAMTFSERRAYGGYGFVGIALGEEIEWRFVVFPVFISGTTIERGFHSHFRAVEQRDFHGRYSRERRSSMKALADVFMLFS